MAAVTINKVRITCPRFVKCPEFCIDNICLGLSKEYRFLHLQICQQASIDVTVRVNREVSIYTGARDALCTD
ncbi:MAG TPA: hypothetical protein VJ865_09745 [Gemmatimonadaceae bacterium]|nr:hypothetical protein [Gemmatimonadaceae bacterium]